MAKLRNTRRVYPATDAKDIENIVGGELAKIEINWKDATFIPIIKPLLSILQRDHRGYFNAAQDANGTPWAPLAPATVNKKGHATILVETRSLKNSLTNFAHPDAIRDLITGGPQEAITFGTSDKKAYWHQHGTTHMPARPPVGITEDRLDETCEKIADSIVQQMMSG